MKVTLNSSSIIMFWDTFMKLDEQQHYQYHSLPEISKVSILIGWLTSWIRFRYYKMKVIIILYKILKLLKWNQLHGFGNTSVTTSEWDIHFSYKDHTRSRFEGVPGARRLGLTVPSPEVFLGYSLHSEERPFIPLYIWSTGQI